VVRGRCFDSEGTRFGGGWVTADDGPCLCDLVSWIGKRAGYKLGAVDFPVYCGCGPGKPFLTWTNSLCPWDSVDELDAGLSYSRRI
jgi:hypothetical protein